MAGRTAEQTAGGQSPFATITTALNSCWSLLHEDTAAALLKRSTALNPLWLEALFLI